MSKWNHPICEVCWDKLHPERKAFRLNFVLAAARCCFCGEQHHSGIFVWQREKPPNCDGHQEQGASA